MTMKELKRRHFLRNSAALAVAGGFPISSVQAFEYSRDAKSVGFPPYDIHSYYRDMPLKPSARTPLQDLAGFITPNPLHFVTSHGILPPEIDPQEYQFLIHGMVERPLVFTLDELKRLPAVSRIHFIQCAGSSYVNVSHRLHSKTVQDTHGKTSNSVWTGVPLSVLLNEAGVKSKAKWILAEDVTERHTVSIPLDKAMDDALLVYGQNGEAVYPSQGYPLRLLTPGWEGVRNVKWLRRIEVGDQPYMTRWETSVYTNLHPDGKSRWFQFQLEPNSVITFPSGEQQLSDRGYYEITGLAWSGGGAVSKVEVSTDGGKNWHEARLQEPVLPKAHTRFCFPWRWDGKETVIQSRCMDERGDIQPTVAELNKIWGVNMDFWTDTSMGENRVQHLNPVQPWRIKTDGSVHNAIWET